MKLGIAGAGMIVVQGLLEFVHDIEGIELLGICATKRSEEKLKKLSGSTKTALAIVALLFTQAMCELAMQQQIIEISTLQTL